MYLDSMNLHNQKLVFVRFSKRRYKYEIENFIRRFSGCENAGLDKEGFVMFDGITYINADKIKRLLLPYGCQTRIEPSDIRNREVNEKLRMFLKNASSAVVCLRCGSSHYKPDQGLLGLHPSRWICRDCGWSWEY